MCYFVIYLRKRPVVTTSVVALVRFQGIINQTDPEVNKRLMERRIGVVAIFIRQRDQVHTLNNILSQYSQLILGRLGLPLKDQGINVISLIVQGSTDEIGALSGKIGRLTGIQVKSVLNPYREESGQEKPAAGAPETDA